MRLDQCVTKWTHTGLLQGLSREKAEQCAVLMEDVCHEVMEVHPDKPSVNILIPVIRRMANDNFFPPAHWVVRDFKAWWEEKRPSQDFSLHTEEEIQLCCKYADECPGRYQKSHA